MIRKIAALSLLVMLLGMFAGLSALAYPADTGAPNSDQVRAYFTERYLSLDENNESTESVASIQPAQESFAPPKTLNYQVQSGDTIYGIASAFQVNAQDLLAMNDIANPKLLQIGQALQIPPTALDAELPNMPDASIKRVLTAKLTAYTAGFESTGKTKSQPGYGITYSGSKVEEGRTIAVDPSIIPLGSTVYIEGIGVRKAEDTGGAIRGKRIDVYMENLDKAREFGVKQNVKVYVLSDSPSNVF